MILPTLDTSSRPRKPYLKWNGTSLFPHSQHTSTSMVHTATSTSYNPDQKMWDTLPFMQNWLDVHSPPIPSMQCWVTVGEGCVCVWGGGVGGKDQFSCLKNRDCGSQSWSPTYICWYNVVPSVMVCTRFVTLIHVGEYWGKVGMRYMHTQHHTTCNVPAVRKRSTSHWQWKCWCINGQWTGLNPARPQIKSSRFEHEQFARGEIREIAVWENWRSGSMDRDIFRLHEKLVFGFAYRNAEYVPNKAAELIPTAKPIMKPTLTRSKQLGWGARCILVLQVLTRYKPQTDSSRQCGSSREGLDNSAPASMRCTAECM